MTNSDGQTSGEKRTPKAGKIAGGGFLSALLALLGASCCVLPIILVNLGVSSALVSYLGVFGRAKPLFMVLSLILICAAFYYSFKGGRRPSRRIFILLTLTSVLVLGAYILPFYESRILQWINLK